SADHAERRGLAERVRAPRSLRRGDAPRRARLGSRGAGARSRRIQLRADRRDHAGGPQRRCIPQGRARGLPHVAMAGPRQAFGQNLLHRAARLVQRSHALWHSLGRRDGPRRSRSALSARGRAGGDGLPRANACAGPRARGLSLTAAHYNSRNVALEEDSIMKGIIRIAFAATAALLIAPTHAQQLEVKLGHVGEPGSIFQKASDEFARRANAKLGNKAKVIVYGSSQLGGDKEMVQKLKLGTLDMAVPSTVMSSEVDLFGIFDMPYIVKDRAHMAKIEKEIFWPKLEPEAEKKGLKVLAVWENGIRHITNN